MCGYKDVNDIPFYSLVGKRVQIFTRSGYNNYIGDVIYSDEDGHVNLISVVDGEEKRLILDNRFMKELVIIK